MPSPAASIEERLLAAGIRPTAQRTWIARLLFDGPHRHVTAAEVWSEVREHGPQVSLATVYNTLNELLDAGLLRAVPVTGARGLYFDTNVEPHHHLLDEDTGAVVDLPAGAVQVSVSPEVLPAGVAVDRVEVWVRVRGR